MPKQSHPQPLVQSNVRMPRPAIDEYEAWAQEINVDAGWNKTTRSDVMRDVLLKALEDRRAAAKKGRKK